jgi:hypothetical protein
MKRSRNAGKSKARGTGWTAETFQESDSEEQLGQPSRQHPKELHPHAIVNATPAGAQSAIVNAVAHPQRSLPTSVLKPFQLVDTPLSKSFLTTTHDDGSELNMDSIFESYGLMDPELSAAWDEDHGLKAKRARTASVRKLKPFLLDFVTIFLQDNPMLQWRDYSRDTVLEEMLRLEGRGVYAGSLCGECFTTSPHYRCTDCFGGELFCQKCTLSMHRRSPFHIVEVRDFHLLCCAALSYNV